MIFKMDTDAVRGMAARFRRSAGRMESSLSSIRQSVSSAPWQSQAREEHIRQLELLHNSTLRSAEILSLMGTAAEQKANQWEAIANRFNTPWVAMSGIWNQLKSMLGWVWSRIKDAFGRIRLPSVPQFVGGAPVGVGAFTFSPLLVVGGLYVINPDWFQEKPLWWPFKPKPEPVPQPQPQPVPKPQPQPPPAEPAPEVRRPVEPVGLNQGDERWGNEVMNPKSGEKIKNAGCLMTSVTMIARLNGADVTPYDTNKYLQDKGGYTGKNDENGIYREGSYMKFDVAASYLSEVTGKNFFSKSISSSQLNSTLNAGQNVIIHIKSSNPDGHWVLATGIDSLGNYIVYDAGTGKQSTITPSQLHKKDNHIAYISNG